MWMKIGNVDVAQWIIVVVDLVFRVQMCAVPKRGRPDSLEKEPLGTSELFAQPDCTRQCGMIYASLQRSAEGGEPVTVGLYQVVAEGDDVIHG